MRQILAATDFSTRSQRAVRRAGLLARQSGAELMLLHVVDDDQPLHLVELERKEAAKILDEQNQSIAELRDISCRRVVTAGDAFDAILRTAEAAAVDLIVMGAHRKHLLRDIFVGTTIERVVRTGSRPVLMVNSEVAHPYVRVLAAVDMSDASARALQSARALGFFDNAHLSVVHAFEAFAKSTMFIADVPQQRIDRHVAEERQRASAELQAFLQAHGCTDVSLSHNIEEGDPCPVISQAVKDVNADLLVVGTHGRSGISKVLLGSVAEEVLRSLEVDILTVPRAAAGG